MGNINSEEQVKRYLNPNIKNFKKNIIRTSLLKVFIQLVPLLRTLYTSQYAYIDTPFNGSDRSLLFYPMYSTFDSHINNDNGYIIYFYDDVDPVDAIINNSMSKLLEVYNSKEIIKSNFTYEQIYIMSQTRLNSFFVTRIEYDSVQFMTIDKKEFHSLKDKGLAFFINEHWFSLEISNGTNYNRVDIFHVHDKRHNADPKAEYKNLINSVVQKEL